MALQVPYPPPRVTFCDIAGLVSKYREHSYLRWFMVCDGQPNSTAIQRSYSLPGGAPRTKPPRPRKEPAIPSQDRLDPGSISPVRARYLLLDSPSRVRSRSAETSSMGGTLPGGFPDPHELIMDYDNKIKSFEAQVAGLKSAVRGNDLTRTQRRLRYLDYRTDDPVVLWAKKKCKAMELSYAEAMKKLDAALEAQNPNAAAQALHHLEKKVSVDDDAIRAAREKVATMSRERSAKIEKLTELMATSQPVKVIGQLDKWPFNTDDVGLNASRDYVFDYKQRCNQLKAARNAGDVAGLQKALSSWPYVEDDEFLEANVRLQKLMEAPAEEE